MQQSTRKAGRNAARVKLTCPTTLESTTAPRRHACKTIAVCLCNQHVRMVAHVGPEASSRSPRRWVILGQRSARTIFVQQDLCTADPSLTGELPLFTSDVGCLLLAGSL